MSLGTQNRLQWGRLLFSIMVLAGMFAISNAAQAQDIVRLPGFLPDTDKYSKDQDRNQFQWYYKNTYIDDDGNEQQDLAIFRQYWALSIPQDTNGNRILDPGEDWSEAKAGIGEGVWRVLHDNSCWAAAANNLAQTITGISHYHSWMYVEGVPTLLSGIGGRSYWYSGGDQAHEPLTYENYDNDTNYADEMLSGWWDVSPESWIYNMLKGGKPVAASVEWDLFQGHVFTVYGIDRANHRLWIVDSDSDDNGDDPYWLEYRWHESGMGGFFQGNWEDEAGNSRWFDMNTFTSFMTRRWNNMEDGRFGREANWSGDKDWEVWEISLFGSWNSATVRITDNQSATRLVLKDQGINLIIEPGASLALRTFMLTDQARLDIHGQLRVADQQTIDGNVYLWPGGSLDNFVDTTIIGAQQSGRMEQNGGTAVIWKLILAHEYMGPLGINRAFYDVLGGTLSVGEVVVGYEGRGELGLETGTQLLRNTSAFGQFGDSFNPDTSSITLGLGQNARGYLYMNPDSSLETNRLVVGSKGFGYFEQRGGMATIIDDMIVGADAYNRDTLAFRGMGEVRLKGDSYLKTGRTIVGDKGQAWFIQQDTATHDTDELIIGYDRHGIHTSVAWYSMYDGTLGAGRLVVGVAGIGTFAQTGGHAMAEEVIIGNDRSVLSIFGGSLWADALSMEAGTLQLGGSGGLVVNGTSHLAGIIEQGDESVFITRNLILGRDLVPTTYSLTGNRLNVISDELIGPEASFEQNAGEHNVAGTLRLDGTGATYQMNDGILKAANLIVGDTAAGTFVHNSGTIDLESGTMHLAMAAGSSGRLEFNGGTLIADTIDLHTRGEFVATSGQGNIRVNQVQFADTMGLSLGDLNIHTLQVGHGGRDYAAEFRMPILQQIQAEDVMVGYNLQGHSSDLYMGAQAKIAAKSFYLGYGQQTIGRVFIDLGNSLTSDYQYVGYQGEGTVSQTQGINRADQALYLGFMPGSAGYYTLSGGKLLSGSTTVGAMGAGTMSHWGGEHTVYGDLFIGFGPGSDGRYVLDGGILKANDIWLGYNGGAGRLEYNQGASLQFELLTIKTLSSMSVDRDWVIDRDLVVAGGNLILNTNRLLTVGFGGTATLTAGNIVADNVFVGGLGTAASTSRFNQQGGSHFVTSNLIVGPDGQPLGIYTLTGGSLSAAQLIVGDAGRGRMFQSQGSVTLSQEVAVGRSAGGHGEYAFFGGNLQTPLLRIGGDGSGSFDWSGGTLLAARVEVNANGAMNVTQDWTYDGQVVVGGGHLAMGDRLLSIVNPTMNWQAPPSLMVAAGNASLGDLTLARSNYYQYDGTTSVTRDMIINVGSANISGGDFSARDVYVARGSDQGYSWTMGSWFQDGGEVSVRDLLIGFHNGSSGYVSLSDGLINATNTVVGIRGEGSFNNSGGIHTVSDTLLVGESRGVEGTNSYTLSGDGVAFTYRTRVGYNGWGKFDQAGGMHRIATSLDLGPQGHVVDGQAFGEYYLRGGQLEVPQINVVASESQSYSRATLYLQDGTLDTQRINVRGSRAGVDVIADWTFGAIEIDLSEGGALWHGSLSLAGTAVTLNDGQWYGDSLMLQSADGRTATFTGHGYFEIYTELHNSGRITADGSGTPHILDMSQVAAVTSAGQNTGHWGWFARNQGTLVLPSATIEQSGTYTFGDDPTGQNLQLVNSMRMTISGINPGNENDYLVSLLSVDALLVPQSEVRFIGVWDITVPLGASFQTASLIFRYDDLLAADFGLNEADLRVFHYDGYAWLDVTGGRDLAGHCIFTSEVSSFSLYAVGAVPEPGTIGLLAVGLAMLIRRRHARVNLS